MRNRKNIYSVNFFKIIIKSKYKPFFLLKQNILNPKLDAFALH